MEDTTFNSVKFLFTKPAYEGYYYYALDNLESMQIMDKESLRRLLIRLGCGDFMKISYLMDRNFPFFFDVKKKELLEFKETNSDITKEDLRNFIKEELKAVVPEKKSQYEIFFGKESNFWKNSFTEEIIYGNNKSIQSNLPYSRNCFFH